LANGHRQRSLGQRPGKTPAENHGFPLPQQRSGITNTAFLWVMTRLQPVSSTAFKPATGEPLASADGCCRLRLSGYVLPGTAAVSGTFFANPINLQPAAAHVVFADPVS
jgi:hypothetical protein